MTEPSEPGFFDGVSLGIAVTVFMMIAVLAGSLIWQPQLPEGPKVEVLPIPGITAPAEPID